jgi:hypothetical protein
VPSVTTNVEIVGDSCNLAIAATNLTGDEIEFLSGSFVGSPDERRVANVFFIIGGTKTFVLRFEFFDPTFIETTLTGKPIFSGTRY